MKYLAIFKDSLREALDTKVFYVTVALSLLAVLVIGSVSYEPVTLQEGMKSKMQLANRAMAWVPKDQRFQIDVADFEQTNAAAEPWLGTYRFVYVFQSPDAATIDKLKKGGLSAADLQKGLAQEPWIETVTVVEEPVQRPGELRFQVDITKTKASDRRNWPHSVALLFGAIPLTVPIPLSVALEFIADWLIATFAAAIIMILSIIITAFFIPNMLRKGTIDLLLAKPIHRTTLLVNKFIGGMTFMFLNTIVIMAGIWLVLGVRSGVWLPALLLAVLVFTFQFAIFYSVSTLTAVLTRSPIVAILAAIFSWALLWGIGNGYRVIDALRPDKVAQEQSTLDGGSPSPMLALPGWVFTTADVIHWVAPGYKDLDVLTTRLIRGDLVDPASPKAKDLDVHMDSIQWRRTIPVTLAFIGIMLSVSCWWFARHDY